MSRKKISGMRRVKGGIPLFIGCWPRYSKQPNQYESDTWHLPRKNKSTESVANKRMTRGAVIINQLYIRPRTSNPLDDSHGRGGNWWCHKSSKSITRPYVSSNERSYSRRRESSKRSGEPRPYMDEEYLMESTPFTQGKPSKMVSSIFHQRWTSSS